MKTILISLAAVTPLVFGAPAPQTWLNGISNFLTNTFGSSGNAGEVDDYENAPYRVIQKYDGYEERFYPSRMWVCTRSGGRNGGFMKLFGYISGENSRSKINIQYCNQMTTNKCSRAKD